MLRTQDTITDTVFVICHIERYIIFTPRLNIYLLALKLRLLFERNTFYAEKNSVFVISSM